ncbi:DnaJ domain protein [Trichuris suis]|nr:DnaJ domain protein [Trichuris suis]
MASSSFEEECKRYFGSSCLYAVLGLEKSKNLTAKQVRQAYYNAVLAHHPDRCEGISKSEATEKFQLVSKAFAVLGNDEKRDMYFRTGRVDENDFCEEKCWIKYWRCFYKEVADSMLKPFAVVYRVWLLVQLASVLQLTFVQPWSKSMFLNIRFPTVPLN